MIHSESCLGPHLPQRTSLARSSRKRKKKTMTSMSLTRSRNVKRLPRWSWPPLQRSLLDTVPLVSTCDPCHSYRAASSVLSQATSPPLLSLQPPVQIPENLLSRPLLMMLPHQVFISHTATHPSPYPRCLPRGPSHIPSAIVCPLSATLIKRGVVAFLTSVRPIQPLETCSLYRLPR